MLLAHPALAVGAGGSLANAAVYIPAVESTDTGYRGALATLELFIKDGSGHVFVDTLPLTEIDTQAGARIAREAVEETLNTNLDNYDIFFVIRSDAPIVGGPSAGGAMATVLLAMVLNLSVDSSVVMTGTSNTDGSIGPVGGLLEKAQAVAEHNGTVFLIPEGQSVIKIERAVSIDTPGGGGTVTISEPQEIDLREYAKTRWNLTVIEVPDIKKALEHMTGYKISVSAPSVNKSVELEGVMKEMSSSFLTSTDESLNTTKSKLASSSVPYQYEQQLKSILEEQEKRVSDARQKFGSGDYYSASSYCFMASIQLRFIRNSIDLLESKDMESLLNIRLRGADSRLQNVSAVIEDAKAGMDNINDVEVILLSSDRLDESRNYMKDAWKSFYSEDYFDSAYYLSYAEERAATVERWLVIADAFGGDSLSFTFSDLGNLTQLRISEAASLATYAQIIGVDSSEAESMLENARKNYESGEYPSALFNAITARAYVDAMMEMGNMDFGNEAEVSQELARLETNALRDMQSAQERGILPIMAINYYEYGKGFEGSDPESAVLYLIYAKHFAKASRNILEVFEGKGFSSGVGSIDILPAGNAGTESPQGLVYLAVAASFAAGTAVGLAAMAYIKGRKTDRAVRRKAR
jgi:uncharacterized protein